MASSFPGAIDNFTDPLANSSLASPSHAGQHSDLNDAVEKIEQYMGLVKVIPTAATNGTINATTGTVTIGNAVSSVSVTCFSALYDNYRIVVSGMVSTTGDNTVFIRPGGDTTAASYFSGGYFVKYDGTGNGWLIQNGTASGISVAINDTSAQAFAFDIFSPFLAQRTRAAGMSTGLAYVAHYQGYHNQATSYSSFTMVLNSGTMTGGTIRVYGYRN